MSLREFWYHTKEYSRLVYNHLESVVLRYIDYTKLRDAYNIDDIYTRKYTVYKGILSGKTKSSLKTPLDNFVYDRSYFSNYELKHLRKSIGEHPQVPYSYSHIYKNSNDSVSLVSILRSPIKVVIEFYEYLSTLHTLSDSTSVQILSEYNSYKPFSIWHNYIKTIYYSRYDRYLSDYTSLRGKSKLPFKMGDFVHDDATYSYEKHSSIYRYYAGTPSYNAIKEQGYFTEFMYQNRNNSDISQYSLKYTDVYPFNVLDDYNSIYNYFLYRNAGINYLDYRLRNDSPLGSTTLLDKLLYYNDVSSLYLPFISPMYTNNWTKILLKSLNISYQDSFISPFYNHIFTKDYIRSRYHINDSLLSSALFYHSNNRTARTHKKGSLLGIPRTRDLLYYFYRTYNRKIELINTDKIPRWKRHRLVDGQFIMKLPSMKRAHSFAPKDSNYYSYLTHNYPLLYDIKSYYLGCSNSPISSVSSNLHSIYPNLIGTAPLLGTYKKRLGSRLLKRLQVLEPRLDNHNDSVYVVYLHNLKRLLSSYELYSKPYNQLSKLYNSYVNDLSYYLKDSLIDSYYFRKNVLVNQYHQYNRSDSSLVTGGNLIQRYVYTRNKFFYKFNNTELLKRTFNLKLSNYDLITRMKVDLLSKLGISFSQLSTYMDLYTSTSYTLNFIGSVSIKDLSMIVLSMASILGHLVYYVYYNIDIYYLNLWQDYSIYAWLTPLSKDLNNFWYSSQFFYLDYRIEELLLSKPHSLLNSSLLVDTYKPISTMISDRHSAQYTTTLNTNSLFRETYNLYSTNNFFYDQHYYYIYQNKGLLKLPYFDKHNSAILFFQWDNLPLYDLISNGLSTNLLSFYQSFTYNLLKYDSIHLVLLGLNDLLINLIVDFDISTLDYIVYSMIQVIAAVSNLLTMIVSSIFKLFNPFFVILLMKLYFFIPMEFLGYVTSNLTFLNIKHIVIDLPLWFIIDSAVSYAYYAHSYLHSYDFNGFVSLYPTYRIPIWNSYFYFDNIEQYYLNLFYSYYHGLYNSSSSLTLGQYLATLIALFTYYLILAPFFYIFKYLMLAVFVEGYALFFCLLVLLYYYVCFFNTAKNYAWLYKDFHSNSFRKWLRRYHIVSDIYIEAFLTNTESLAPYKNRRYFNGRSLQESKKRQHKDHQSNSFISNYYPNSDPTNKYYRWNQTHYQGQGYIKYLYEGTLSNKREGKATSFFNSSIGAGTSDMFFKQILFSSQYLDFKTNVTHGPAKYPLFGTYPDTVSNFFKKGSVLFNYTELNQFIFTKSDDFLIPFILLGKHYEDQNNIVSLDTTMDNFIDLVHIHNNITDDLYIRFYYLSYYFPFYGRFITSTYKYDKLVNTDKIRMMSRFSTSDTYSDLFELDARSIKGDLSTSKAIRGLNVSDFNSDPDRGHTNNEYAYETDLHSLPISRLHEVLETRDRPNFIRRKHYMDYPEPFLTYEDSRRGIDDPQTEEIVTDDTTVVDGIYPSSSIFSDLLYASSNITMDSDVKYEYLLWDGGSHSVFLLPGIASYLDEHIQSLVDIDAEMYSFEFENYHSSPPVDMADIIGEADPFSEGVSPSRSDEMDAGLIYPFNLFDQSSKAIRQLELSKRYLYSILIGTDYYLFNSRPIHGYLHPYLAGKGVKMYDYFMNLFHNIYSLKGYKNYVLRPISQYTRYTTTDPNTNFYATLSKKHHISSTNKPFFETLAPSHVRYLQFLLAYIDDQSSKSDKDVIPPVSWSRDFDIGATMSSYSIEYLLLQLKIIDPSHMYHPTDDVITSYAWNRVQHSKYTLQSEENDFTYFNWIIESSTFEDIGSLDHTDLSLDNDMYPEYGIFTALLYELRLGYTPARIIPPIFPIFDKSIYSNLYDSYYNKLLHGRGNRRFKQESYLFFNEPLQSYLKKLELGKYYRYLNLLSGLYSTGVDITMFGIPLKKDLYLRNQKSIVHYPGNYLPQGRYDYYIDMVSSEYGSGFIRAFNFIFYKSYPYQVELELSPQLLDDLPSFITQDAQLQQWLSYDNSSNNYLLNHFFYEINEFSSSIYYSWLTQRAQHSMSYTTFNFIGSYKNKSIARAIDYNSQYDFNLLSSFPVLRPYVDYHNHYRHVNETDSEIFTLNNIKNFYQYDSYSNTSHSLFREMKPDTRVDEALNRITPKARRKQPYSLYRHFRSNSASLLGSAYKNFFVSNFNDSFQLNTSNASILQVPANQLTDINNYEYYSSLLLRHRILDESFDHLDNLINYNIELATYQINPIHFYKVPSPISGRYIEYIKYHTYYSHYDNQPLNELKESYLHSYGGSWKYYYFRHLLYNHEYDYIFENTLSNQPDSLVNYKLLKAYCEQGMPNAWMTKDFLIYREKIKSISPNSTMFFFDFYPEYAWEYYDFDWWQELKNDWFLLLAGALVMMTVYTSSPYDNYKVLHNKIIENFYMNNISNTRKGQRRRSKFMVFPLPNRLKRKRLLYYRIQSRNVFRYRPNSSSYMLSKPRYQNHRNLEYFDPYKLINPKSSILPNYNSVFKKSRYAKAMRMKNPKKYVFYTGYTIHAEMNRRRFRKYKMPRFKAYSKDYLFNKFSKMRSFEPANLPNYEDKLDERNIMKRWKLRDKRGGVGMRVMKGANTYRYKPKKPFRKFYTYDFYKTMLYNDLLKLYINLKAFIFIIIGTLEVLISHFIKNKYTWEEFEYVVRYIWKNKYSLLPSLNYLRTYITNYIWPKIHYTLLHLVGYTNTYTKPFGFTGRSKLSRKVMARRSYNDKMAQYTGPIHSILNQIVHPLYYYLYIPYTKFTSHYSYFYANVFSYASDFKINIVVLSRILKRDISIHNNPIFNSALKLFLVLYKLVLFSSIKLISLFKWCLPILVHTLRILLYCFFKSLKVIFYVTKPFYKAWINILTYCKSISFPLKFITINYSFVQSQVLFYFSFICRWGLFFVDYVFASFFAVLYHSTKNKTIVIAFSFYFNILKRFINIIWNIYTLKYNWHTYLFNLLTPILYYPYHFIVKPIMFFISLKLKVIFLNYSFIQGRLVYWYVEPILYFIIKKLIVPVAKVFKKSCSITKWVKLITSIGSHLYTNYLLPFFTTYIYHKFIYNVLYKTLLYIFQIIIRTSYKFLNLLLEPYAILFVLFLAILALTTTTIITSFMYIITTISIFKYIFLHMIVYLMFILGYPLYIMYAFLTPFYFILISFFKFSLVIPLLCIKTFVIYIVGAFYVILLTFNSYYEYMFLDNCTLLDLFKSLWNIVIIEGYVNCFKEAFFYTFIAFKYYFFVFIGNSFYNDVYAAYYFMDQGLNDFISTYKDFWGKIESK